MLTQTFHIPWFKRVKNQETHVEIAVIEPILSFLHFPDEVRGNHNKLWEQSKCVYYETQK